QLLHRLLAVRSVEQVALIDAHPRQIAPLLAELVAQPGEVFFRPQQLLAGCQPVRLRDHFVVIHGYTSIATITNGCAAPAAAVRRPAGGRPLAARRSSRPPSTAAGRSTGSCQYLL